MNRKNMNKMRILVTESILLFLTIVIFLFLYSGGWTEILGVVIGILVTQILTNGVLFYRYYREDKNKLSDDGFRYDDSYIHKVVFGDKSVDIWYDACVNSASAKYTVNDSKEFTYKLPTLVETNYLKLLGAHSMSFKENRVMVRLDDYEYDREENLVTLYTSRTMFFNDLVTNRVVDYKIDGDVSLRDIYESARFLTPLGESSFSNHIGLNAMVFLGDKLLLTLRGATGTISKNMFTSTVAIGLFEDALSASVDGKKELFSYGITSEVVVERTCKLLNITEEYAHSLMDEGKMRVHFLGFGRLIYMGGKPQFYYAVTIDEGSVVVDDSGLADHNQIDYNETIVSVAKMELAHPDRFCLKLTTDDGRTIKREAESSFFVNYWHLVSQDKIDGIPDWIYDGAKGTTG